MKAQVLDLGSFDDALPSEGRGHSGDWKWLTTILLGQQNLAGRWVSGINRGWPFLVSARAITPGSKFTADHVIDSISDLRLPVSIANKTMTCPAFLVPGVI